MLGIGAPELIVILVMLIFGLGGTILWVWMLVDCATNEPREGNDKVVWVIVIALTHWVGALVYLFVRRPRRRAAYGR